MKNKKIFNKDEFLVDSLEMFLNICSHIIKNTNYEPDFTEVLGNVIENFFNEYNHESVIKEIGYNPQKLECDYEFDEANFDNFFDETCIIKDYRQALAYYSLNQLFLDRYEEFLEDKIGEMCEEN